MEYLHLCGLNALDCIYSERFLKRFSRSENNSLNINSFMQLWYKVLWYLYTALIHCLHILSAVVEQWALKSTQPIELILQEALMCICWLLSVHDANIETRSLLEYYVLAKLSQSKEKTELIVIQAYIVMKQKSIQ